MASLSNISIFHSLCTSKLISPHFAPIKLHHQKAFACSVKKPRGSRKVKSNAELCNDIRAFLSEVGLPEDHVPSMKQLSQHGRQDLAHIVRRRGYKVVGELLAASATTSLNMSVIEEGLTGRLEEVHDSEDKSTGQNKKVNDLADDVSLPSDAAVMMNCINGSEIGRVLNSNFTPSDALGSIQLNSNDESCISPEASIYTSMQEKAAKFIQDGQLDTNEDSFGILRERNEDAEYSESQKDLVVCSGDGAEISSENYVSSSQQDEDPVGENRASRNSQLSIENSIMDDHSEDLVDETQSLEDQADINRLRFMLYQKEMELTQLKQEIEREKLALSALQTIAGKEISKAQKLISEKDAELQAAEESLSELKEVEILFRGDGENVEVSGSFNGWHQTVKMELIQSSTKSRLWSTALWLYPGVYEIKFVVDGKWKIDPQRESVVNGSIHNNILRVDR